MLAGQHPPSPPLLFSLCVWVGVQGWGKSVYYYWQYSEVISMATYLRISMMQWCCYRRHNYVVNKVTRESESTVVARFSDTATNSFPACKQDFQWREGSSARFHIYDLKFSQNNWRISSHIRLPMQVFPRWESQTIHFAIRSPSD